jgi:hypothetical protein
MSGLSLTQDEADPSTSDPATDFRVLGVQVFEQSVFDRYRDAM